MARRSELELSGEIGERHLQGLEGTRVEAIGPRSRDPELHGNLGQRIASVVVKLDDAPLPGREHLESPSHLVGHAIAVGSLIRIGRRQIGILWPRAPGDRSARNLRQDGGDVDACPSGPRRLWGRSYRLDVDGEVASAVALGSKSTVQNTVLAIAAPETVQNGATNPLVGKGAKRGAT